MSTLLPFRPPSATPESADLFDWRLVRHGLSWALGALRRRWMLALSCFLLVLAGAVGVYEALPRSYQAEAAVLVAPHSAMTVLVNPQRMYARDGAVPLTRGARERVMRRDNLLALVQQHDLLTHFEATRPPLARAKRWLRARVLGPETDEARRDALVGYLRAQLWVTAEDNVLRIGVRWPEPQMAQAIANSALEQLLAARRDEEVATLREALGILEGEMQGLDAKARGTVAEMEALQAKKKKGSRASSVRGMQAEGRFGEVPDGALSELRLQLLARRKAIESVEETRRKRVAELQTLVTEQKSRYAEDHPYVRASEERLAALEGEPEELASLRAEEQRLLVDFVTRGGRDTELAAEPERIWQAELMLAEPAFEYARSRLAFELRQYATLRERVDTARAELATAQASFKYRYGLVQPATLPQEPTRPLSAKMALAALLAAGLFALFAAVAAELLAGRVVERWQVERLVGVPVLAEVRRP